MIGSDIVAIVLVTLFGAGFIYLSFIVPMRNKKNGLVNEPNANIGENLETIEIEEKSEIEKNKNQKNLKKANSKNKKIMK